MSKLYRLENGVIEIIDGNIADYVGVESLVCPTTPGLLIGNVGTTRAIKDRAGREFLEDVDELRRRIGSAHPQDAYVVKPGNIPIDRIVLSVCGYDHRTPSSGVSSNPDMVQGATMNALRVAHEAGLKSIGFSALGTGNGGVSLDDGISRMLHEFGKHLLGKTSMEKLGLILYGSRAYSVAQKHADAMLT